MMGNEVKKSACVNACGTPTKKEKGSQRFSIKISRSTVILLQQILITLRESLYWPEI